MTPVGLPHSGTHGSMPAYGSPWHFAADRALLRLLAPRHPPYALSSLTSSYMLRHFGFSCESFDFFFYLCSFQRTVFAPIIDSAPRAGRESVPWSNILALAKMPQIVS